eukprot:5434818-Pyramimonas_sp.AAC.1
MRQKAPIPQETKTGSTSCGPAGPWLRLSRPSAEGWGGLPPAMLPALPRARLPSLIFVSST